MGWFPLNYPESFYSSAVEGKYFSLLATFEWEGREVFAGLICISDEESNDDSFGPAPLMFGGSPDVRSAYILTLGVVDGYRRRGLANELVRRSIEYYKEDERVKLIYLHVILYNTAAIRLYERNGFER